MPRIEQEKLAFDLRKYALEDRESAQKRLAEDLTGLSFELAEDKDSRVTPFTFEQHGEKLVAPEFDEESDILEWIEVRDKLDWLEFKASQKIKEYILEQEEFPLMVIWILPPFLKNNRHPEGRINIGIGKKEAGVKIINNWGIASQWSEEVLVELGNWLGNFSQKPELKYQTSEQLRGRPIFIDKSKMGGQEPLDFLEQIIPLPDGVWKKIKSQEVKEKKKAHKREAGKISREVIGRFEQMKTKKDWIKLGAWVEEQMQREIGYQFRSGSGCGILNSEKLAADNPYVYNHSQVKLDGQVETGVLASTKEGKYVEKCGNCGAILGKRIRAGYVCPVCGAVYKGC